MAVSYNLFEGNCLDVMKTMDADSIDSIVTDPPYELGFMGKSWDSTGIAFNVEVWQQALRVLKPGGHLIAFSGSRTYHRMAVAIEDAGFEIRDQIMWVYGSGFPKSHDVSKGIDKNNGKTNRLIKFTQWMRTTGLKAKDVNKVLIDAKLITENGTIAGHYFAKETTSQPAIPTVALWQKIRPLIAEVPVWVDELVERIEAEREVVGTKMSGIANAEEGQRHTIGASKAIEVDITAPATAEAKQWQGWGTALKPAHEPMVLARKPVIGTVANNVLTWGVGGLNIDGSRVEGKPRTTHKDGNFTGNSKDGAIFPMPNIKTTEPEGRWPANFIHDGSDEVLELFPIGAKPKPTRTGKVGGQNGLYENGHSPEFVSTWVADEGGSAARFFYCAKTSKRDRNEGLDGFETKTSSEITGRKEGSKGLMGSDEHPTAWHGNSMNPFANGGSVEPRANHHPTVKPTDLMRYLVKLVTPPNGTVLDPFMGSGSTGKGAMIEGFNFIGIELTAEYLPIARARIEFALNQREGELDFEP